jgi:hypothetical protein
LKEQVENHGHGCAVVSVEDELCKTYALQTGKDPADRSARESELREAGGYKRLLNEAPSFVRAVWSASIKTVDKLVLAHLSAGRDVLLTFHAVYYADKFGDFYSPVDPKSVASLPAPTRVFCFIDDIGDVATRLRADGQVFSNRSKTGLQSVVEALRDLLTILEWRSSELTVTRLLAALVGQVPLVLAVKHPLRTAERLLDGRLVPTYISHSISEARRTWHRTGSWPPFMHEVQRFTNALGSKETPTVPILPTTIDEFRLLERASAVETLLLPAVGARWELPAGPLLVEDRPADDWLDPRKHFKGNLTKGNISRGRLQELRNIHGLLHALSTRIDNQVNARDHTLVEQSPALIVYRPYYAWRVSGGVAAEVKHQRDRLKALRKQKRTICFVHKRPDDPRFRSLGRILSGCRVFRWVRGETELGWPEVETLLKDGLTAAEPAGKDSASIRDRILAIAKDAGIEIDGLANPSGELVVLGKPTSDEQEQLIDRAWERIAKAVAENDSWKRDVDEWIEADATPEQFASEVVAKPRKPKKALRHKLTPTASSRRHRRPRSA